MRGGRGQSGLRRDHRRHDLELARIDVLWLPEPLRGQGLGHGLLERAEQLARRGGCDSAMLDTFDFEARAFYESHGYFIRSQTDDFPPGHTHYRLTKAL